MKYGRDNEKDLLSEEEVQRLLSQPIDKGRRANDEDINLVKRLLEKEKQIKSLGSEEFDKMAAQLDRGFEVWIKEYDDCLTITCEPMVEYVKGSYRVFSVFNSTDSYKDTLFILSLEKD